MHEALKDKVIVITGGSGVLCRAMAKALAAQGAKIAIINRTAEKGEAVVKDIQSAGGTAMALACDVLDKEALLKARETMHRTLGTCDILINGAGGNNPKGSTAQETHAASSAPAAQAGPSDPAASFFHLDPAGFEYVFNLNFMGTLLPSQVFAPDMLGKAGCSIINISSMGSFSPMTKVPAYCAAKAAINNFTQWMSVHFASSGIRVNALAPGFFSTEQNQKLLWYPDGSPTPRTGKILAHTPMGRLGTPDDLCGTILWLADPTYSGFVTGTVVAVDGGFMAYSGV